jgi:dihydroorotate dehydrogenase electron transfer subunit
MQTDAKILANRPLKEEYFQIDLAAPEICRTTQPGQFVHVKIGALRDRILRRPFSIFKVTADGVLSLIYKVVGEGTSVLSTLAKGEHCNLMGPLGRGFTLPGPEQTPVLVAGGYGVAAMYLLAKAAPNPGLLLLGARNKKELLLVREYQDLGFTAEIATEDGSAGTQGLVTDLLVKILTAPARQERTFCGCGPLGMLLAMGKMLNARQIAGELSLDHLLCCGVGACYACVIKVKADHPDGWRFVRTCREGPVFKAKDIYYEN